MRSVGLLSLSLLLAGACGARVDPDAGRDGSVSETSCTESCTHADGVVVSSAGQCSDVPRPSDTSPEPPDGACVTDADCVDGAQGRCTRAHVAAVCTYHECASTADCGDGAVCVCGVGPLGQNRCLADRCRGADGCRVSSGCGGIDGVQNGAEAIAPASADDACRSDADCRSSSRCSHADGAWRCIGACSD